MLECLTLSKTVKKRRITNINTSIGCIITSALKFKKCYNNVTRVIKVIFTDKYSYFSFLHIFTNMLINHMQYTNCITNALSQTVFISAKLIILQRVIDRQINNIHCTLPGKQCIYYTLNYLAITTTFCKVGNLSFIKYTEIYYLFQTFLPKLQGIFLDQYTE